MEGSTQSDDIIESKPELTNLRNFKQIHHKITSNHYLYEVFKQQPI